MHTSSDHRQLMSHLISVATTFDRPVERVWRSSAAFAFSLIWSQSWHNIIIMKACRPSLLGLQQNDADQLAFVRGVLGTWNERWSSWRRPTGLNCNAAQAFGATLLSATPTSQIKSVMSVWLPISSHFALLCATLHALQDEGVEILQQAGFKVTTKRLSKDRFMLSRY